MAEHLIVVQAVEGSSPFVHPLDKFFRRPLCAGVLLCLHCDLAALESGWGSESSCVTEARSYVCATGDATQ